jgi:hypothetical protein
MAIRTARSAVGRKDFLRLGDKLPALTGGTVNIAEKSSGDGAETAEKVVLSLVHGLL